MGPQLAWLGLAGLFSYNSTVLYVYLGPLKDNILGGGSCFCSNFCDTDLASYFCVLMSFFFFGALFLVSNYDMRQVFGPALCFWAKPK